MVDTQRIMASSNPFRRSVLQPKAADSALPQLDPIDMTQTYAAPPRTSFRDAEPSDADEEPEPEPERKHKPVKKVRVLTPPPLSPDSPEWPAAEPMYQTGAGLTPPSAAYDPFAGSATDESDRESTATPPYPNVAAVAFATAPPQAPGGPPGNPFSRTLQDMEDTSSKEELDLQQREEGEVLKAANSGTPALNVDAFRRLLLTGNSGIQGAAAGASADNQALASYNAEANKTVAALDGAQDQSQTNNNIQQDQRVVSPLESSKDKKLAPPPPPPSSRHGKTIRSDQPKSESERQSVPIETKTTSHSRTPSGNDIEFTSGEDSSADSHSNEAAAPSGTKKAAPAPPPRRGHARTDTKSNPTPTTSFKPNEEDHEPRSSIDSAHRQERAQIPAPPPPRRPYATPKQSGAASTASPAVSSSSIPQRVQAEAASPSPSSKSGKSAAPPRPPSRNPSAARRLPGGGGGSSADKRDGLPPPPPPRRSRGSSSPTRKSSAEMAEAATPVDPSKGADILADLDALRREVEALRGAR